MKLHLFVALLFLPLLTHIIQLAPVTRPRLAQMAALKVRCRTQVRK